MIRLVPTVHDGPVALAGRLRRTHAPLSFLAVALAFVGLFFVLGIWADGRTVAGAPVWLKPAKFAVSIALYCFTLTWLLGFVRSGRPRLRRIVHALGWVIAAAFVVEMVLIAVQAGRATTSHFNVSTALDARIYGIMALSIVILWSANVLLAVVLAFMRFDSRVFGLSVRLGLVVAILGMAEGFLMTSPTAQQMASWQAGAPVTIVGAHAVGVPDGGAGLPVTGWSTTGGDLRVGHFVGMHALQVLPLLGWFLTRRRALSERRRMALVALAAAVYLGVTLLLVWQALRAQPLLAPDALTAAVFVGLSTAGAAAAAAMAWPALAGWGRRGDATETSDPAGRGGPRAA